MFQLAYLLIACVPFTAANGADRQPNIVVLFADDLGYGELSCQGCPGTNPGVTFDESVPPPYYVLEVSRLRDPCNSNQEDMPYDDPPDRSSDFVGLDNDGNGFADYPADSNCPTTTTSTTTSTTTTTTLPLACSPAPLGSCAAAGKAKLQVNEKKAGKESVKFALAKLAPEVVQADFGDPVADTTAYALCVYDEADVLVGQYEPGRGFDFCGTNPCWSDFKDVGFNYVDKGTTIGGMLKIQLKGGAAGKGKVKLIGKNGTGTMTTGVATLLNGDMAATAQFVNSHGDCFGGALPTVKKADGQQFKAQAP